MPKVIHKSKGQEITRRVVIFFILIFAFASLFYIFLTPGSATIKVGRIVNPIGRFITIISSPLGKITQIDLLDKGGQYAVVVRNLKTGEEYSLNKDQGFHSASLYKLWVLAVAQSQIEGGALKLDTKLSAKKKDLDRTLELIPNEESTSPSPGEPSPTPKPEDSAVISMTVGQALNQMIKVSDNYAALLLVKKIGARNIEAFIKQQGFNESGFGSPPTTSAKDIASYMEKLYKREFVGSVKMIDLLKKQEINDRIPKYLPKEIEVAHKTGELSGAKHDAGIVFSKKGDYIIVVMSQTNNETVAAANEAIFSRDVFNYFQSKE
jgi:beta-lactamase class A